MTNERGDRGAAAHDEGSDARADAGAEESAGTTDPGSAAGPTGKAQPDARDGGEPAGAGSAQESAGGGNSSEPGEDPEDSMVQLESLQSELDLLNDRHLRLAAEFDNYRKRIDRERSELRTRSQAELVRQLLDVLDDLQRVSQYDPDSTSAESLLEGVDLLEKKLRRALESAGLEPIEAEGEFFNPEVMEALMTLPAEHPEEDDVVADVFQKGYRFKDVLIRPARVRVKKYED